MAGQLLFVVDASSDYHPALAPHFPGWTRQDQLAEHSEVTGKGSWPDRNPIFQQSLDLGVKSHIYGPLNKQASFGIIVLW